MTPSSRDLPGQEPTRRGTPRLRLRGPVSFCSGDVNGQGTLYDISMTGALIEAPTTRLAVGARCWLALLINANHPRVHIGGTVVRKTENAFAVEFTEGQQRLKEELDLALSDAGPSIVDEEDDTKPLIDA